MSGMVGWPRRLPCTILEYYTLKAGQVHSHESALVPSDTAAVLEWNLDVPLQAPCIAMVVTINGERSLRRYRLVVAQKSGFAWYLRS